MNGHLCFELKMELTVRRAGLILAMTATGLMPFAASAKQDQVQAGCPPGLAKKSPACVPPGQAKNYERFRVGDRLTGDYILIRDPGRYGLDRRGTYYRADGYVIRVDRETREILDLIGAIDAVLN